MRCCATCCRRRQQGDHRSSRCPHPGAGHAVRAGRGGAARAGRQFLADLRGLDAQLRETKKKLAAAVRASGTSLTEVFGFGPVNTGTVIGDVTDVTRFPSRDHFASYNGTAPVEVSSGNRKIYRLSLRGNRRINHALHMAAITQIRHRRSDGRAYYDRKIAEGKTHKEALRCLKRRISDAVFARLRADARKATVTAAAKGPGGQPGNDSDSSAAGLHPEHRLFGQATPEPGPTLRPASPRREPRHRSRHEENPPDDLPTRTVLSPDLADRHGRRCHTRMIDMGAFCVHSPTVPVPLPGHAGRGHPAKRHGVTAQSWLNRG